MASKQVLAYREEGGGGRGGLKESRDNLRITIIPACIASSSSFAPFYKELDHKEELMGMTAT